MKVIWSPDALFDMADLREYIAEDNPDAARRVAIALVQTVEEGLSMNPQLGHPGRVPGTRELVMPKMPFIIAYRIHKSMLEVLGVYHHARRWRSASSHCTGALHPFHNQSPAAAQLSPAAGTNPPKSAPLFSL